MDSSPSPFQQAIDEDNRDRVRNIVVGQRVTAAKHAFAKKLRMNATPTEVLLWERLRRNQLNGLKFRRQQVIDGFIVDFYCHSARLIIEVDGGIHQQQVEYDLAREEILKARGLRIVRFSNGEVLGNIDRVLLTIAEACL
jgi:very-short-patch-repair endonuclease